MKTYQMICSNGWTTEIKANTLLGAKRKATAEATYDCGNYTLITPEGKRYTRRRWEGFNAWGWDNWVEVDENY